METSPAPAPAADPPDVATRDDHQSSWSTGWLGISTAGMETHGSGEMFVKRGRNAHVMFSVLHSDGEMYKMLELRYARSRARVDLYLMTPGVSEALGGPPDPFELWESVLVPNSQRPTMRDLIDREPCQQQELFARMAAFYVGDLHVLTAAYANRYLSNQFDDGYHPDRSQLWRPVDFGVGPAPFTWWDAESGPEVQRITINNVAGYFVQDGHHQVFVRDNGEDWQPTPIFGEMASYFVGTPVRIDELPTEVQSALWRGISLAEISYEPTLHN